MIFIFIIYIFNTTNNGKKLYITLTSAIIRKETEMQRQLLEKVVDSSESVAKNYGIDVILDKGISELAVSRSEYRAIFSKGGISALLDALSKKATALLGG